ncbi:MAG: DUF1565 domain-containing protein, partial [Verrucomicrobiales bacterium]|nr:DUF1565 domain-containing protein [Verrucomicrobiales bacterium]
MSPAARSAEIYVHWDPRYGNDSTGNGSEALPFRTITRAHQAARATDILRFAGGTYSERTRLEKSVRLTRVGGIAKLGQATLPTIPYTTFDGRLVTRALVKGQKVALLPSDPTLHPPTLDRIASALDRAYDAYLAAAGRPPQPYRMIQGLLPIAAVDQTCGAGCGYLESTGIELQQVTFDRLYNGALFRDQYDQTPFYELGRNFWLYESKIAYRESTATPISTGFAVFMRFYSMEAAGVAGGPINDVEFGVFKSAIEALVDDYLKSPSYQWGNTLAVNRAPTNPYQLNGTDLFASFLFRLRRDFGGNEFIQRLWRAVDARPVATNTQGAIDNFVVAASLAAQRNLISLFRQTWRWPVSQAADIELGRLCPTCEGPNQNLVVSAGADQVVNGNPSAAPVAATLTAVVTRGGTPTSAAIRWEQVSGPCRSTIDNPTSLRTIVRMPCLGTFTFRVSATQGSETATDALLVTVRWDGVNAAPVITMPTRLVVFGTPIGLSGIDACAVLSASVVDDGQPNPPGKVTTRWSRVTGPTGVTFETPLSATTRACFSGIGTYVLRLVATDGDPSGNPAGLTTSKDI